MEDLVTAPWLRRLIIAALLAAFVLLGFRVMDPFIVPLVWAGILAFASWPAYRWLRDKCRGHTTVAAVLMTSAMTAAVIAPLAWLAVVLRVELTHAWHETQTLLTGGVQLPPAVLKLPWIGAQLRDLTARAAQDPQVLGEELRKVTDHSFNQIAHLIGGIGREAVKLLLAVVSLFFVYRDGERLATQLTRALGQVLGARVHHYLQAIGQTVKAVVYGLVLAALHQGCQHQAVNHGLDGLPDGLQVMVYARTEHLPEGAGQLCGKSLLVAVDEEQAHHRQQQLHGLAADATDQVRDLVEGVIGDLAQLLPEYLWVLGGA